MWIKINQLPFPIPLSFIYAMTNAPVRYGGLFIFVHASCRVAEHKQGLTLKLNTS